MIETKGEGGGGGGASAKTYKTLFPNCLEFDYKYLKKISGCMYGEHGMRFQSLKNSCHTEAT